MAVLRFRDVKTVLLGTAGLLLIPLFLTLANPAAQIYGGSGGGFDWSMGDFAVMALLLVATGLGLAYLWSICRRPMPRLMAALVLTIAFLLVWAELAVDLISQLFGDP